MTIVSPSVSSVGSLARTNLFLMAISGGTLKI